eukprot:CAMPEP_0173407476 /NCGR_PEP_ID=MMETSP1356-20130122/67239_1 /TAXON_ID=77927 ORGANISM="Hemiselmis virescens, Strain PCC157" /NCGR_SAMPLE_ID=MMETSP1356 /ASSEMBLY_ACC=CAM_ASM_000847 /LENGTH=180 /DNA_ID=CAMNT_0014368663 /DNA_START=95 /DNA_END=634 /DNA_ORIENTATION=-
MTLFYAIIISVADPADLSGSEQVFNGAFVVVALQVTAFLHPPVSFLIGKVFKNISMLVLSRLSNRNTPVGGLVSDYDFQPTLSEADSLRRLDGNLSGNLSDNTPVGTPMGRDAEDSSGAILQRETSRETAGSVSWGQSTGNDAPQQRNVAMLRAESMGWGKGHAFQVSLDSPTGGSAAFS